MYLLYRKSGTFSIEISVQESEQKKKGQAEHTNKTTQLMSNVFQIAAQGEHLSIKLSTMNVNSVKNITLDDY